MYKRKFSLKTRYNFKVVFKHGKTYNGKYLIIKYLKPRNNPDNNPKFAIITSNKLTKIKVLQNKTRRIISSVISENLDKVPEGFYYVIIPKKNILDTNGKISIDAKKISTEINTFLSEMVVN